MKEKCHFCEHDFSPIKYQSVKCTECHNFSNFKLKTRLHPKEAFEYEKLQKEENWINDKTEAFDRDTALAVLKALSKHMHASHDLFGEKTLVIKRARFEAVRKKFLD